MRRTGFRQTIASLSVATLLAASKVTHADDQELIDYREHIMKTLGEQTASIEMILQHKAPSDAFVTHLKILAVTATTAKKAFEPKVLGGNAKPEVWTNWADFSKRLDALVSSTEDLAKTAQQEGFATVGPKVLPSLTCKSCHDMYRTQRK